MDPPPPPPPPRDEDLERRKHSTTNSMFTGSTIGKPNVDSIIHAVATILHSQMLEVSYILLFTFWQNRIRISKMTFQKILTCTSSRKKNTSKRNLRRSTNRELHF